MVKRKGVEVKVLVGELENVKGPMQAMSPINVFDVKIDNPNSSKDVKFDFEIPRDWNRLMFVYDGKMDYNDAVDGKERRLQVNESVILNN